MSTTRFFPQRSLCPAESALAALGIPVLRGSDGGYNTEGDIVRETADGVLVNTLWDQFQAAKTQYNANHDSLTGLLTFGTTDSSSIEPQVDGDPAFYEEASEFGLPKAIRPQARYMQCGYTMKDYDAATRYTWRFLRDATAQQVRAVDVEATAADRRTVNRDILTRLLDPTPGVNAEGIAVYGLWNGTDGQAPPAVLGKSFDTTHSHYKASGGALIDSEDLEVLMQDVTEHGYGPENGDQLVVVVNPQEGRVIRGFRAGEVNNQLKVAEADFIPSAANPAYLTDQQIIGDIPPATVPGTRLPVIGSYGEALIAQTALMPPGYVLCLATGGPNSPRNLMGYREHRNPAYRGLRLLPGTFQSHPLIESLYTHSFGVGVRRRGAASVLKIASSGPYVPPTLVF